MSLITITMTDKSIHLFNPYHISAENNITYSDIVQVFVEQNQRQDQVVCILIIAKNDSMMIYDFNKMNSLLNAIQDRIDDHLFRYEPVLKDKRSWHHFLTPPDRHEINNIKPELYHEICETITDHWLDSPPNNIMEYLIKRTDGDWFDYPSLDKVFYSTKYELVPIKGDGEYVMRFKDCIIKVNEEEPGLHVIFEGKMEPKIALELVQEFLQNMESVTNQTGTYVRVG